MVSAIQTKRGSAETSAAASVISGAVCALAQASAPASVARFSTTTADLEGLVSADVKMGGTQKINISEMVVAGEAVFLKDPLQFVNGLAELDISVEQLSELATHTRLVSNASYIAFLSKLALVGSNVDKFVSAVASNPAAVIARAQQLELLTLAFENIVNINESLADEDANRVIGITSEEQAENVQKLLSTAVAQTLNRNFVDTNDLLKAAENVDAKIARHVAGVCSMPAVSTSAFNEKQRKRLTVEEYGKKVSRNSNKGTDAWVTQNARHLNAKDEKESFKATASDKKATSTISEQSIADLLDGQFMSKVKNVTPTQLRNTVGAACEELQGTQLGDRYPFLFQLSKIQEQYAAAETLAKVLQSISVDLYKSVASVSAASGPNAVPAVTTQALKNLVGDSLEKLIVDNMSENKNIKPMAHKLFNTAQKDMTQEAVYAIMKRNDSASNDVYANTERKANDYFLKEVLEMNNEQLKEAFVKNVNNKETIEMSNIIIASEHYNTPKEGEKGSILYANESLRAALHKYVAEKLANPDFEVKENVTYSHLAFSDVVTKTPASTIMVSELVSKASQANGNTGKYAQNPLLTSA